MANNPFLAAPEPAPGPDADWQASASCSQSDPDLWYPEPGPGHTSAMNRAKATCRQCPVAEQCLEVALANNERWGIWGGINFTRLKGVERDRMRRDRGIKVVALRGTPWPHGTLAGAARHRRAGESPCGSCREAVRLGAAAQRRAQGIPEREGKFNV